MKHDIFAVACCVAVVPNLLPAQTESNASYDGHLIVVANALGAFARTHTGKCGSRPIRGSVGVSLPVYILVCSSSSSLSSSFGISLLSSSAGTASVVVRCRRLLPPPLAFSAFVDSLLYLTWVRVRLLLFFCSFFLRFHSSNGLVEENGDVEKTPTNDIIIT